MRIPIQAFMLALAFSTIAGCQSPLWMSADPAPAPGSALFGGRPVREEDDIAKSVAALSLKTRRGRWQVCSATLISARILLTAAHCVPGRLDDLRVSFGAQADPAHPSTRSESLTAAVFPKKYAAPASNLEGNPYDIALLLLKKPAPAGMRPLSVHRASPGESLPSSLFFAGFGLESLNLMKEVALRDFRLRAGPIHLTDQKKTGLLFLDQTQGSGICSGDSGGAALVETPRGQEIVGVASSVNNARSSEICQGQGVLVDIAPWSAWIQKQITLLSR